METNTHPYCSVCRPSLRSQRQSSAVRVRTVLSGQTGWRLHDQRLCHVPGNGTNLRGGGGGYGGSVEGGRGGHMVHVQCLKGPLLWVLESETSRKAERIRLKDLSERDDTSSDVIPFVSIFGRIFNLMVPAGTKPGCQTVRACRRGVLHHRKHSN